ncbi:MAG: hypothetical protein AAF383_18855 [Cyanobacteria bacterium P01_A01_bin.83]
MDIEKTRKQAQDENTAPEILDELVTSEDYLTRKYVAGNPNTPTQTLLNSGEEFPRELLNNPIFDLLVLENPNLISDIPIKTLRSLIKQNNVPESFIVECAERESDKDLLLGIAMNPKISRKVLDKLTQSKFSEVVEAAKLHINWSGEITTGWQELAEEKIKAIRPLYSGAATRIKHLQHEQPYLSTLARLGWIPDFLILYWQKYWNKQAIFSTIANSSYTSPSILAELGKNKNYLIKKIVAKNPNTPVLTLENLAKDNTEQNKLRTGLLCGIKVNLSRNPNSSSTVLKQLIEYDNFSFAIRKTIAKHPNCSINILENLLQEGNTEVILRIANNLNTPIFLLKRLLEKHDYKYSPIGQKAFSLLKAKEAYLSDSTHSYIKRLFICIPEQSKILLREQWNYTRNDNCKNLSDLQKVREQEKFIETDLPNYLQTDYLIVRLIILLNSKTPATFLQQKSSSLLWLERYAIAQNPNIPLELIQELANDANKIVRAAAKDNLDKRLRN